MMSPTEGFVCEALYHGYRPVEGSQSPSSIAHLVEAVVNRTEGAGGTGGPEPASTDTFRKRWPGCRVQLQLDEERLRVVPVRKDEGFESDSEGSSGSLCDDTCCNSAEVKVIRDHVLRLDKLLRQDACGSNGNGNSRLTSTPTSNSSTLKNCKSRSSNNSSSSSSSSSSTDDSNSSATSTNSSSSSDDNTPSSGLLTDSRSSSAESAGAAGAPEDGTLSSSGAESEDEQSPRLQRALSPPSPSSSELSSPSSSPPSLALVQAARHTASSPDSSSGATLGSDTFLMSDILYCHICGPHPKVVVVVVKAAVPSSLLRAHVLECLTQQAARTLYSHYYKASNQYKLNRYRNSKRKSELNRESSASSGSLATSSSSDKDYILAGFDNNSDVFHSLRSCAVRKDSGTSSISETSSVRGSIRSLNHNHEQTPQDKNINVIEVRSTENVDDGQPFSLVQHTDNNGITHIEIESGPVSLVNGGSVSSDYSSIISLSTPENNNLETALRGMKTMSNRLSASGNSCPNSLITSDREIIAVAEKDKKFRQRQPALLIRDDESDGNVEQPRSQRKTLDEQQQQHHHQQYIQQQQQQQQYQQQQQQHRDVRSRKERYLAADNSKLRDVGRPPLPPPSSWAIPERPSRPREMSRVRDHRDYNSKGKHSKGPAPPPPPRRHPHDSSLLLVPTKSGQEPKKSYYPKESHIVRGNKVVRVDFPSVPVWTHMSDPNNNAAARQYMHYTGGWAHEYHAPRIREPSLNSEIRRRSRSKSPARKATITNRYIDAVTTFNFSQKLKEISDAVFSAGKRTHSNNLVNFLPPAASNRLNRISGHQRTGSTASAAAAADTEPLRPVIKKGTKLQKSNDGDNRRVTFSAYATVQLMDS